jgi:hypothetical protein
VYGPSFPPSAPNVSAQPRIVRVCVVDTDGRRVPGARVTAARLVIPESGGPPDEVPVAQLVGDVETLTPRTGPSGIVDLTVPGGSIRYDVTLAGAAARVESDGDEVTVELK